MKAPNIMKQKYSTPITSNVCTRPTECGPAKAPMSEVASGDPIMAPPPNPMIASPVAMPGRSTNHLMSVETGEMYPSPSPIAPRTP
jgi:hypothetical protein